MKYFLWPLLAIHVLWGTTHLILHSQGLINPWKLGGYGMYTVPTLNTRVTLEFEESDQDPPTNFVQFTKQNLRFYFRSWLITPQSIHAFIQENPELRGKDFTLLVKENHFSKDPLITTKKITHKAKITWASNDAFRAVVKNTTNRTRTYELRIQD